ncbi:GntR family transcriptional regulator [Rubrivivax gelatinosus]|uniref:Regulatory GntR family protein n=1 Tax=Rubrivivax gelatinosus TaxID=28068 RepID=A0A4R2MV18_RUBGE|nr:GntR family transcriptional regulator [Rubrivivax gelatinosus]MBK1689982.1 hypothetical protein [Rubrivivax gelatinosus]TCP03483.1 regulatory GntR family protein [Rubrivivax gelatinosus]
MSEAVPPLDDTRADVPRLPRAALCDAIAESLRARVLALEWAPGEALDELAIARDYGVSRTPVREAMKVLQHEGLLQAWVRRGVAVAVVEPQELQEAAELRRLLLAHAAARGASAGSPLLQRMLSLAEQRLRLGQAGLPPAAPGALPP